MSAEERPLVTVIVGCFNHEPFVEQCLDAVLAQRYPNTQLVVVDDASTDGSRAAIERWLTRTGTECELVVHPRNLGICRTRNDGVARARGSYIATISADDVWLPGKLHLQVAMLDARPEAAVVYGDAFRIDAAGERLPEMFLESCGIDAPPEGDIYEVLLDRNFIPAPTTMMRRSCLEAVGEYDEALAYEDWDMWLRLSKRYAFAFCPTVTAEYRVVPTSALHTLGDRIRRSSVDIQRKHLGYSPAWDAVILRRTAVEAYACGHPGARAYLREAVQQLGWSQVGAYYALATLRVSRRIVFRIVPVRALPGRVRRRGGSLLSALARRLRRRRDTPESRA